MGNDGRRVDLHLHSTRSDGVLSPRELVRKAAELGLAAIALTDHDEVSGVPEAIAEGRLRGVKIVPGVEISCHGPGYNIHLLGLFVDPENPRLLEYVAWYRGERIRRARRIAGRLEELGLALDFDLLLKEAGEGSLGRPHIAERLLRQGFVENYEEAFARYIGDGKPAFVPKRKLTSAQATALIADSGGLAILAHPGMGLSDDRVTELVRLGIDGIEVYHPKHSPRQVARYRRIVQRWGLLESGGSDCHGREGPLLMGTLGVGWEVYEKLERAHAERHRPIQRASGWDSDDSL